LNLKDIKLNCRYFRGDIPCKPNKLYGVHCISESGEDCKYYEPVKEKILIIKLGAVGDVIRTTPLVTHLKRQFPLAKLYWLTYTPAVVPQEVDVILKFNVENVTFLKSVRFDYTFNLDKDIDACALLNGIDSKVKKGFILEEGVPFPADNDAVNKYFTGIFDDLSLKNTKSYPEEIFEICGFKYSGEKYILSNFSEYKTEWEIDHNKKVIGLNTGCGGRWPSRLWADKNWISLAEELIRKNDEVIFLGGEQEHIKNKDFSIASGGKYPGHFHLEKFINLVDQCDLVVTGVTMAMHITIGLGKKIVLFNNIFNSSEFELFGLGEIVEPDRKCKCFYSPICINTEYNCMDYISVDRVLDTIEKLLGK
jgi:ADP-heptose:LPS heptosyltransferase